MQFIPCCLSDFFFHSSGLFCSRHMAFLLPLTHTASQLYFITVAQVLASGLSVPPSQDTCKLLAAHQGTLTHETRSSDLLNHSKHVPVVLLTPVCGLRSAPPPHGPRSHSLLLCTFTTRCVWKRREGQEESAIFFPGLLN